jgi:uracil-DNA glycosylase
VIATIHPSAVLRARGADARAALYADFVADLRQVAKE